MQNKNKSDFKEEDKIQAIVIADSFDSKFEPLTFKRPKCLIPLGNIPFLEFVLESLSSSGVQETYIFTCQYANMVKDYINNSKWNNEKCRMKVHVVMSENCYSLGEALREIDNRALIRNDFVLIQGGVLSNVRLQRVIEEHKRRKLEHKNAIMTMLMMEHMQGDPLRLENEVCLSIDKITNRIISYKKIGKSKKLSLPLDIFEKPVNEIRFDLLPCRIEICSPVILHLMSDNFDYQTIDDLVRGILVNEEILGNTMYLHALNNKEYAVHVDSLNSYKIVSNHLIKRLPYPLVIDNNFTGNASHKYRYDHPNIYSSHSGNDFDDFNDFDDCDSMHDVVLGAQIQIGDGTSICNSVVGHGCKIGSNVKIQDSIIFDDVVIENDCTVTGSFIDNSSHLHESCHVPNNCVLGRGVNIFKDDELKVDYKLVSEAKPNLQSISAENTNCFILPSKVSNQDAPDGKWSEDDEEEEDDDDEDSFSSGDKNKDYDEEMEDMNESKMFYDEVVSNLERSLNENISAQNVILEINSVKHAYGIQIRELTILVTKALLNMPLKSKPSPTDVSSYYNIFQSHMTKFLPILENYVKNESSQGDVLVAMEELADSLPLIMKVLPKVIMYLFDKDVLTEEGILKWWRTKDKSHSEEMKTKLAKLIEWLETDDSTDDDNTNTNDAADDDDDDEHAAADDEDEDD